MSRPWTHWATSVDLEALRVPDADAGTGLAGRPLGRAVRGGDFVFDPFDAYASGLVSNPNVVVAGAIGTGKSTVVKMMVDRALERGRHVVVVDPKGEYGELAQRHGQRSFAPGRDGWCTPFPDDDREARALTGALLASARATALSAEQHFALDVLWEALPAPRPPRLLAALLERARGHLGDRGPSPARDLAVTLHRFVHGDLAGLVDGVGEPLSFADRLVVLDLSASWSSGSLPIVALSATAAAQRVASTRSALGYLVLDEAWALLSDPGALGWLRGSWKLARARGLAHLLVLHRWSDVAAVGDEGSVGRATAQGLLRECESSWLFRQPPDEAGEMARALGLADAETRLVTSLGRGSALVRYGAHRSVVRVRPDERDAGFVDTDAAMRSPATS